MKRSLRRNSRSEEKARIVRRRFLPLARRLPVCGESLVCARRQCPAARNCAEMECIGARAEAECLPKRTAPSHPSLMGKTSRRRGHGVKPPTFLGLEAKPVADGDGDLFGLHIRQFDRPKQNQKLFAEQALNRRF